jgi:ABC-type polysaccharide/polyol phosphate export permease
MLLTTWIALDFGLGLRRLIGPGYGLALICGFAAWLLVSDGVSGSLGSIVGQPHLVKKVAFPVALLPLSTVLSGLAGHAVVLAAVILIVTLSGTPPSATLLTLPFWIVAALLLAGAVGLFVSSLNVVVRDAGAVVPPIIGLWFWLTPIVWPLTATEGIGRALALANPMTFLVEGYRYALLGTPFPGGGPAIAGGALVILLLMGVSFLAFRRLRPVFADSL